MKLPLILAAVALLAAAPAAAQHDHHAAPPPAAGAPEWTKLPTISAGLRGRMGAAIEVFNGAAFEATVTAPDGAATTLPLAEGKASHKPAVGNYHLVTAVDACDVHVATASTAVYFPNPGDAPTAILEAPRKGLTIMPERLPREHAAYRAGETWRFVVTMDGQPFPGAKVRFETANGSREELVSDIDGTVDVTFPEDFPPRDQRPPEAHGRPVTAGFVVAAIHQTGTLQHIGAFNHSYRPGAFDGSSLATGAGFAVLGMVFAAPLLRRRKGGAK